MVQKLRQMNRAHSGFFEDFSLDSMSGSDDGNYQSQTIDISEDSKASTFEQTEIVENIGDLLTKDQKEPKKKDNKEEDPKGKKDGETPSPPVMVNGKKA